MKRSQSPTGTPAVLVIESAKFQRRSLCRLIRATGADRVVEAVGIDDAQRVMDKEPAVYWLVVADPDLIGAEGLGALKALAQAFPVASTLLLSNRRPTALGELRDEARKAGLECIAALRKPVSAEEIGTLLQQVRKLGAPLRNNASRARVLSKEELSECLRAGSVRARFQPKVDLTSGQPVGCEAAPYVTDARYGVLHAASFAQAMTQLGAQRVMTASLLRDAAELVRSLRAQGLETKVAVKLGGDMLSEAGDAASLDAYVRTLGIAASDLAFEITSTRHEPSASLSVEDNLARLRVRGYTLVIDVAAPIIDFNSPAYAHFSEIKLHLPRPAAQREPGNVARELGSMLAIARNHGLTPCAVGVGSDADLIEIRRAGFRLGQGGLFAAPLSAEETLAWIAREDKDRSFADQAPQRHRAG